jgi:hypothetical protein
LGILRGRSDAGDWYFDFGVYLAELRLENPAAGHGRLLGCGNGTLRLEEKHMDWTIEEYLDYINHLLAQAESDNYTWEDH